MELIEIVLRDSDAIVIKLIFVGWVFGKLLSFLLLSWSRLMRHLNIRKNGWPPEHLDADGDFANSYKEIDED